MKIGVVGIESAVETGSAAFGVKRKGREKRSGVITVPAQYVGRVGQLLRQHHGKIDHPVVLRIGAGKNGCVRDRCQRSLRVSVGENGRLLG